MFGGVNNDEMKNFVLSGYSKPHHAENKEPTELKPEDWLLYRILKYQLLPEEFIIINNKHMDLLKEYNKHFNDNEVITDLLKNLYTFHKKIIDDIKWLESGIDEKYLKINDLKRYPFICSVRNNSEEEINYLITISINKNCMINLEDYNKLTALDYAIMNKRFNICDLLVGHNATITERYIRARDEAEKADAKKREDAKKEDAGETRVGLNDHHMDFRGSMYGVNGIIIDSV